MKKEIIAVAEFMGMTYEIPDVWCDANTGRILILGEYKPHKDWNELMSVIEKISKMPLLNADGSECTDPVDACYPITFNMPTDDGKQVMFRFKGYSLHTANTLIEAAWLAVAEVCSLINPQTP